MTNNAFDEVLSKLQSVKRTSEVQAVACCPAHDDHTPSLSVSYKDGKVLLKCFAGCTYAAIIAALKVPSDQLSIQSGNARQRVEVCRYTYSDANGKSSYTVIRYAPKGFRQQAADGSWSTKGIEKVPYRLPELIAAVSKGQTVFIVEGEKDADNLAKHGFTVTTFAGGAGKWRKEYRPYFQNADVVLVPDNDGPGHEGVNKIASMLAPVTKRLRMLALPNLPEKGDVSDWLNTPDNNRQAFEGLLEDTPNYSADAADQASGKIIEEKERESAAKQVVRLITSRCELFIDTSRTPYARFSDNGLVLPLDSDRFPQRIQAMCWDVGEFVPSDSAMRTAINTVKGKALVSGEERRVHVRVAHQEPTLFIDLADDNGVVVQVHAGKWELLNESPVMFYRPANIRPLPTPQRGGDVNLLWDFVNAPEESRLLLLALLCEWMRDNTTQPLLELIGEQGSGKSFASRCIRSVVDPNKVMLRTLRKTEDVFVLAANNHLLTIENASKLSDDLQDTLCALSTGGGQAGRKLYSDSEEHAIEARKPVLINGIDVLVTRPDLLDRTVSIILQRLDGRRVESELDRSFEEALPLIFGGLLELFTKALEILPTVDIPSKELPRLGDFALLGEATARAQGLPPGVFLRTFNAMRQNAVLRILEGQPLGVLLPDFIEERGDFIDVTLKQLLHLLLDFAPEGVAKTLPKTSKSLADKLRRLSPALLSAGFVVTLDPERKRDGFHVSVAKLRNRETPQEYEVFV